MKFLSEYKKFYESRSLYVRKGSPSLSKDDLNDIKEILTDFLLSYDLDEFEFEECQIVPDFHRGHIVTLDGLYSLNDEYNAIGIKLNTSLPPIAKDQIKHLNQILNSQMGIEMEIIEMGGIYETIITSKQIKGYLDKILEFDKILNDIPNFYNFYVRKNSYVGKNRYLTYLKIIPKEQNMVGVWSTPVGLKIDFKLALLFENEVEFDINFELTGRLYELEREIRNEYDDKRIKLIKIKDTINEFTEKEDIIYKYNTTKTFEENKIEFINWLKENVLKEFN
jgi:hypothetical protein